MSLKLLKRQAEKALGSIENGKAYTSRYIIDRFNTASERYQKDQVIGNIRNVIIKMASSKDYFSQGDITSLYNRFSNMSGGSTSFRDELGDLLKDSSATAKTDAGNISKTAADMSKPVDIYEKTSLSDAFSVLFSFGSNNDSGVLNKTLVKKAERLVLLELNSLGLKPDDVRTVTSNEHFILCNAYYRNQDSTSNHISVPMQISGTDVGMPQQIVIDGGLVRLTKENVLVQLKTAQKTKKELNISKYSDLRRTESLQIPRISVPAPLLEKFSISEEILLASNKYSQPQINMAASVVTTEVSSWGARPQVKFAGTNDRGMSFLVKTATSDGEKSFVVPVEISGNKVVMPSVFVSNSSKFDFSQAGYDTFLSGAKTASITKSFSRDTDELSMLSYAQLMDVIIGGVANKDYKASEDALGTIGTKFGPDRFKIALDDFQKMIKLASQSFDQDIIKEAVRRGELIRTKNSVEWYCPKLALPLSKIAFDERGRPTPKFREEKRNIGAADSTVLPTNKIVIS